jgi:hypothetical protein
MIDYYATESFDCPNVADYPNGELDCDYAADYAEFEKDNSRFEVTCDCCLGTFSFFGLDNGSVESYQQVIDYLVDSDDWVVVKKGLWSNEEEVVRSCVFHRACIESFISMGN